ncbi:MAG: bifunctional methylenetetrahydrofolate dehydrogenase/methenyltetrahydrofolate cyclohydrolase FolD [Clostridiales bacterium]|nr:bifunctional methylenetetrahydrofolate dehydrogenase/methenyltetrahydrofolate cyclohydrolase FolD [Clostridiales bacterium]
MAEIIDGKGLAEKIKQDLCVRATEFEKKSGRKVGLAVIRVGNDPASAVYVSNKIKACERCNIRSFSFCFDEATSQSALIDLVHKLNKDPDVDGILVQLPLPKHIDERAVLSEILPQKDADGFHAVNAGKLFLGEKGGAVACTPRGIIELIKSTGVSISGKHAVVVGRSNIVGKPVAALLLQNDATVTVCHSRTQNLKEITSLADILVVAVGKSNFITADMVKPGAVVIDVGMNRGADGLCGDVDFNGVKEVAGYITPVPGGVGPMTVAMLLCNTVDGANNE